MSINNKVTELIEFKQTSWDYESQLELMLEDAKDESEKYWKEIAVAKEENDKQKKANEKILYEYIGIFFSFLGCFLFL